MTSLSTHRRMLYGLFWSAVGTVVVFAFHFVFPSMLNTYSDTPRFTTKHIGFSHLEWTVQYHETQIVFVARPATTFLIERVHDTFRLSYAYSFIGVNFFLLFVAAFLVFLLAKKITNTPTGAFVSIGTFFATFTILFSFFSSIYSYDEPLQYVGFFLALFALFQKRAWLMIFGLFIALLARETTLLALPGLLFLSLAYLKPMIPAWSKRLLIMLLVCGAPVLLAGVTIYEFLRSRGLVAASRAYAEGERMQHIYFNLQNGAYTLETILYIVALVVVPLTLIVCVRRKKWCVTERSLIIASLITALINTPIVLLSARVREARLLMLPFLFVWPLLGTYAILAWQYLCRGISELRQQYIRAFLGVVGAAVLIVLGAWFFFSVFYPTAGGNFDRGYQVYFFLEYTLLILFGMMALVKKYARTHS